MLTEMPHDFVYEFVTLLAILNPVSAVPILLAVASGLSPRDTFKVGCYALVISFLILLFFVTGGQLLLNELRIPMPAFQLAGSVLLLLFALRMTVEGAVSQPRPAGHATTLFERAIFPLAFPKIAGTGAILTVVLLTDNKTRTMAEQASTVGIVALCLLCFVPLFALAGALSRWLGRSGIEIIGRVFGLILASIAVNSMIIAIKLSFDLAR
ncbi:MAG: MarC family protein [Rhodospirillaceae bacterium]